MQLYKQLRRDPMAELHPKTYLGRDDLPLAIPLVRVQVDLVWRVREVHLGSVIGPRPKHQGAGLVIEREVRDIDLTHGLQWKQYSLVLNKYMQD